MNPRNYSVQFWLLCLSSFLFFGSFNMILPELPEFLTNLGGAKYKGLIISLFTLTAMISRPFSGKLADTIGRVPIMIFGSLVCLICSLIYPALTSVYGFFLLRFFHGFSTGFTPTGLTAYVADIVPAARRGEAMGLLSTFGTLGMAGSPAIGGWVALHYSLDAMFYCSSLFGFLAMLVFFGVKETLHTKERLQPRHLKISKLDLYEPKVLIPFVVMILTSYSFGVMLTLIPDLSKELGVLNKGLVFTVFTLASVAVRIAAGKISDIYGRPIVLKVSITLIGISMVVTGLATEQWILWVGGVIYGIANGMNSPTLFAWVTDLSDDSNRGRAFGSLYIALELGIGLGAITSGFMYANNPENFLVAFGTGAILSFVALVYLIFKNQRQ
jgi:MFS family permease